MIKAEIICIGDELLIGQVVNSNAAWMGTELGLSGIKVIRHTAIGDEKTEIIKALSEALARAEIVLITGGLGPTKDDITKYTLCEYFNTQLIFDQKSFENVERMFKLRGRTVSETNRKQAELPANCKPIHNSTGTAPGMWFEQHDSVIVSMPGVPFEMKAMMSEYVIPELKRKFRTPNIVHKTILTQGIGESFLSDLISDWEDALPANMKLAYLPSPGMVRLRLSASGNNSSLETEVSNQLDKIKPKLAEYIYGFEHDKLEELVGKILTEKKKTLALAESCSGGYVSHLVTSVPGSSVYYRGTIVPYSNDLKQRILGINPVHFTTVGAVSEEVAIEMARNVRDLMSADYAISTTGIAGPGGATNEKLVGTVWIGIATPDKVFAKKFLLGDNRLRVIQVAGITALNMLRKELLKEA